MLFLLKEILKKRIVTGFLEELGYNISTDMLSGFDHSNYIDVLGNPVNFDTLKFSIFDKHLTQLEHKQFGVNGR